MTLTLLIDWNSHFEILCWIKSSVLIQAAMIFQWTKPGGPTALKCLGRTLRAWVTLSYTGQKRLLPFRLIDIVCCYTSQFKYVSDWRRMCHMPLVKTHQLPEMNKTHSLPREPTTYTFDLHVIRSNYLTQWHLRLCASSVSSKQVLADLFAIFELAGITKHLTTASVETVSFVLYLALMALHWLTLRVSGKQNSLFP